VYLETEIVWESQGRNWIQRLATFWFMILLGYSTAIAPHGDNFCTLIEFDRRKQRGGALGKKILRKAGKFLEGVFFGSNFRTILFS